MIDILPWLDHDGIAPDQAQPHRAGPAAPSRTRTDAIFPGAGPKEDQCV